MFPFKLFNSCLFWASYCSICKISFAQCWRLYVIWSLLEIYWIGNHMTSSYFCPGRNTANGRALRTNISKAGIVFDDITIHQGWYAIKQLKLRCQMVILINRTRTSRKIIHLEQILVFIILSIHVSVR